jgi:hypothetical protein
MSWTVVEVDGNGVRETRKGGTLAGDQAAEQKPKPKMVTWRRCVSASRGSWHPSGKIPAGMVPLEAQTEPLETIKQLPEGEKPWKEEP